MKFPVHDGMGKDLYVAPFTGAWIEIYPGRPHGHDGAVAPFTGAWIEILSMGTRWLKVTRRTLHGCVD